MATSTEKARSLLSRVLREPFEFLEAGDDVIEFHVYEWFKYLIRGFPLWTWQAHSFQFSALPTTYPLDLIVQSILRDDRSSEHRSREPDQLHLLGHLFQRRQKLAWGQVSPSATIDLSVEPVLLGGPLSFHPADLRSGPRGMGEVNPYEDIGLELAWLIEARERARAAGDEEALTEAKADLDRFLQETTVKLRQGRPAKGPSAEILEDLAAEGRQLFELLWDAFPFEISEKTNQFFGSLGVAEGERNLWTARLALPILSKPEIEALNSQIDKARTWQGRRTGVPTPRRFTIWVLSHRLGIPAPNLADRVAGGSGGAWEEFRRLPEAENPIMEFVTH